MICVATNACGVKGLMMNKKEQSIVLQLEKKH